MRQRFEFSVFCNDEENLTKCIDWYNSNYQTDFRIIRMVYDEVTFADIEVTKYNLYDVFELGHQFGIMEQKLREQGKLDW
ncbi:hypothetical protein CLV58_14035 [Spirosoma oryzae]|uniref:Uncharacterized protein n=1 Tax=Spirosoma oryzae TaxID=1469603 RepID=A0A2T0RSG5_9BACT|nr:hypothetical protein [Spirosoma oryzae]PRY24136.1 hypothetical protein CLV58_14035 [Spirosoma oryzae]